MSDDVVDTSFCNIDISRAPAKLSEFSRMLPIGNVSALSTHHIETSIFAVPKNPPTVTLDFIQMRSGFIRQRQNPRRIVAVTETTQKAFRALEKADHYVFGTAVFFPALNLSHSEGIYELVFIGIPQIVNPINEYQIRQQLVATRMFDSMVAIMQTYKNTPEPWVAVLIESCNEGINHTVKFELPQERMDKVSPLPAEKYIPPPDISEKILSQLPRKNMPAEVLTMMRNNLLYCEQVDDPAWLRMVKNDII